MFKIKLYIFMMPAVGSMAGSPGTNEAQPDQANVVQKKVSWYASLSKEKKAAYLMKLLMAHASKKAAQTCTPSSTSPGNKYDHICSFHLQVHVSKGARATRV
jgi:hypothetical protein